MGPAAHQLASLQGALLTTSLLMALHWRHRYDHAKMCCAACLQVHLGPWLISAARTLQTLHLRQDWEHLIVSAAAPLHRLTALRELSLAVVWGDLLVEHGCCLPAQSLTRLRLSAFETWVDNLHIPRQVRRGCSGAA